MQFRLRKVTITIRPLELVPVMPHHPKDEQLAVVIPADFAKIDRRAVELARIVFNLWEIGIPVVSLLHRFKDKKNFHPEI